MKREYVLTFAILVLAVAFYLKPVSSPDKDASTSISYHSMVDVYVNGRQISHSHNLVVNGGLDFIKNCIGLGLCGAPTNFSNIAVGGNTSALAATDTTLANEFAGSGLARAPGAVTSIGTGNWSVSKVWTASATAAVNTTGLFNNTAGGTLFAENYFTPVTLQANDQINVTWTIWVTSG